MKFLSFSSVRALKSISIAFIFTLVFCFSTAAQTKSAGKTATKKKPSATNLPKIKQVDAAGLKNLLKTNGKPLLVNFWATWCDPCREEFPDLVKIDADYKGKIDFVTVSLDEPEEINTTVPKFLAEMKAEMPGYLLETPDEDVVIGSVSKDWQGGLPFTILYDASGAAVYSRMGKVKIDVLRAELNKILKPNATATAEIKEIKNLPKVKNIDEADLSKFIEARKEKSRPLFINFWATWCKPCVKELPDLMKIKKEFAEREIDFMLVSTDSIGSMDERVALFLHGINYTAPSYLLKVKNKDAMFTLMPFWNNNLPFTVIYDSDGKVAFAYAGIVEPKRLKKEIEQVLPKNLAGN